MMLGNLLKKVQSKFFFSFEKNQPHTLPLIELSNNFDHVTLRVTDFEKDFCFQSLFDIQDRVIEKKKEGMVLTSNEIFTFRFLKPISRIKDNFFRSKIIITDKDSHEMIKRAVSSFVQRKSGISCIFEVGEYISNDFSQSLDVIYLINLTDPSDDDFNKLLNDLRQRKAHSCTIFLTYLIDPFDKQEEIRLDQLKNLLNERGLDELLVVGAFNAINPKVASLYNRPSLGYLKESSKKVKKGLSFDLSQSNSCKLAFRLLNILEQMNQFPIIRYLKTFHDYNSVIADFCLQGLNALKENRTGSADFKAYYEDCILLIIDRSFDLLTPIFHSLTYQAFVTQELELFYDSPIEEVDRLLRNESIFQIAKILIETSNKFKTDNIRLSERERNEISQSLIKHTEIINNLVYKLKCGYGTLMDVEQIIVKQSDETSSNKALTNKEKEKKIKDLIKDNYNQITSFDLVRLLMIYAITNQKVKKKSIKSFVKLRKNMSASDVKKIFDFSKLIRSIDKKPSKYYATISNGPLIKNIIDQIMNDSLDENFFPFAAEWMKDLPMNRRKKIILFVRGGLSYNELYLANSFNDFEVILCSDIMLTPRMFLSVLLG